ncbi:hypothetical protein VTO73DRAFT_8910 [Trametes versicolor]
MCALRNVCRIRVEAEGGYGRLLHLCTNDHPRFPLVVGSTKLVSRSLLRNEALPSFKEPHAHGRLGFNGHIERLVFIYVVFLADGTQVLAQYNGLFELVVRVVKLTQ